VRNTNPACGTFPGLEEAIVKIAFQCGLGLHWEGFLGKGSNRVFLKTEAAGLLTFCKDMIGDFKEGSNQGRSDAVPVNFNFLEDNHIVDGFVLPSISLGFDWWGNLRSGQEMNRPLVWVPTPKAIPLASCRASGVAVLALMAGAPAGVATTGACVAFFGALLSPSLCLKAYFLL
jgi:hypothetical protein